MTGGVRVELKDRVSGRAFSLESEFQIVTIFLSIFPRMLIESDLLRLPGRLTPENLFTDLPKILL
jgi:hypothetical protein